MMNIGNKYRGLLCALVLIILTSFAVPAQAQHFIPPDAPLSLDQFEPIQFPNPLMPGLSNVAVAVKTFAQGRLLCKGHHSAVLWDGDGHELEIEEQDERAGLTNADQVGAAHSYAKSCLQTTAWTSNCGQLKAYEARLRNGQKVVELEFAPDGMLL